MFKINNLLKGFNICLISAIGVSVRVIASRTFPVGFTITEFADDADPFDIPNIDIATPTLNVNGELVRVSTPVPIVITLNVIPHSDADNNLAIIFEANRATRGKRHAGDIITLTGIYPTGQTISLTNGVMTNGSWNKVASPEGLKSKAYTFSFEGKTGTRGNVYNYYS